jgi:hypothetical protein
VTEGRGGFIHQQENNIAKKVCVLNLNNSDNKNNNNA